METINNKEIINRIKFFRIRRGLSARKLSIKIGRNSRYISNLERKFPKLRANIFFDIIDVLNVETEEF